MKIKKYIELLNNFSACSEAVKWSKNFNSAQEAWDNCERGDWMLWLIGKLDKSKPYSSERKPIVAVALECARLAWEWMPQAAKDCIELHERWVRGEVIAIEDLRKARRAAYAAAYAAYAADAAYAAAYAAAADAADAAYAAAAAADAADAAYAAAYADAAADAAYAAAADAAAYAADAAYAAAAVAAYAAAYAAYAAADAAARSKIRKQAAEIVRKHYPKMEMIIGNE
jgi:hypothetical protein